MIKGDRFELFGHTMEVQLRKETLTAKDGVMVDLFRYDLMCTCCSYPKNLVIEVTEEDLKFMKEACMESYLKKERIRDE
jgi:hypothetical protein